jgi:hypothetical protein
LERVVFGGETNNRSAYLQFSKGDQEDTPPSAIAAIL